jgi:hypothetical protein
MAQSYDIPLHDIKPIVEIEEYSLYYLIVLVIVAAVFIFTIAYLIYKWLKKRNRYNRRREHFKLLNSLDFGNAKESAYTITLFGATFKDDSLRHKEMYENLLGRLERYKYKKEVGTFDSETISYIELYKGMIDV